MSGHSKWANIQHRKGRQDAKRSNMWTKIVREIIIAARTGGGGDPDMNPKLRLALVKARGANVPKDTIKNAILKGTGQLEGVSYEEVRYEGYGVSGAALIIDCTTDNKVRTVSDVRHILTSNGGSLGTEGSVAFMFKHCGLIVLPSGADEDKAMEVGLEAGAEDVVANEDGTIEIVTPPTIQEFEAVQKALEDAGMTPIYAEITMKPVNKTVLSGEDAEKMQRIIDELEDNDDVSQVYCSAELDLPEDEE
ncbi:YebC/PmpR family DNA-binding transcriptional regulator [Mesosutterella multiformis]|jgi:YebC/PmpR family DNA-binding regulatory protein|uniref:Probable transcriptional regulatory protein MESMUL_08260 n=1 Tax=Mesosutterella multiformis TaxID=2259133 RepID=A0A388SAX8_9BURK|nr:YebC/PmpR family DNA-binding transcriptional regulator [Mesosutterella multiformis]MBS5811678.1 YebC/PmpR family DNA-binding transcriptional regulator [Sutterella sp.]MCH3935940.1 YebC/PmpR family DNA-binding transcriptional regulator [Mesosutterella sp.]RGU77698.1 YebC/PmpR family DNA-binding transcriptional regulator [Sutterella sp. AF15-45LB]RGU78766.1 YebC/PmpR family DNA-binding transcriptional regulator [Sutterella sp. AF15-44LB]RHH07149.1 YebC/PmpR family DNA-binding transcriptional 